MKILLAADGSEHSSALVGELAKHKWEEGTEVEVLSVAHPLPYIRDPLMIAMACHLDSVKEEQKRANKVVAEVYRAIRQKAPQLNVSTKVLEGSPKEEIVAEAERWKPDLIMVGSHGHSEVGRFLLGSVAEAVAMHAPCSVEIVRRTATP